MGFRDQLSLKLTANAPENRPGPTRKRVIVFQLDPFSGALAVSFREGNEKGVPLGGSGPI